MQSRQVVLVLVLAAVLLVLIAAQVHAENGDLESLRLVYAIPPAHLCPAAPFFDSWATVVLSYEIGPCDSDYPYLCASYSLILDETGEIRFVPSHDTLVTHQVRISPPTDELEAFQAAIGDSGFWGFDSCYVRRSGVLEGRIPSILRRHHLMSAGHPHMWMTIREGRKTKTIVTDSSGPQDLLRLAGMLKALAESHELVCGKKRCPTEREGIFSFWY